MKRQDILENQVNYVYLALGSNLGKKVNNLINAKNLLVEEGIKIIKSSGYYETASWPDIKFPFFINSVLYVSTSMNLSELFLTIKSIEKKLGRKKTKKNFPRICDIDIIDFNGKVRDIILNNNNISIPHKSMHIRNFVLFPLFEINKNWKHPVLKKNIKKLIFSLPIKDIRSIKQI